MSLFSPRDVGAILTASAPRMRAHACALLFGMWHHLKTEEQRMLLLEDYGRGRGERSLIEAMLAIPDDPTLALCADTPTNPTHPLAQALRRSLHDIFGETIGSTEVEAWVHAMGQAIAAAR